jgi:hypothetical protein
LTFGFESISLERGHDKPLFYSRENPIEKDQKMPPYTCRYASPRRSAFVLVYAAIMMVALVAFASLAIDFGRVQTVKTQLLRAADASARAAAVSFLTSGVSAAQSTAVAMAAANKADESSITIDPNNDVDFGTWNSTLRTFSPLSGASRSAANAIRVWCRRTSATGNPVRLSFAGVVGFSTMDVRASAISVATVTGGGVVGLTSVSLSGAAYLDAYDSSIAPYSAGGADSNGRVASNGNITLAGSSAIHGDAHPGVSKSVSISGTSFVTGSTTQIPAPMSFSAPTLPASGYTNGGAMNLSGIQVLSLAAGVYHYTSITMSNSAVLNINGAVTIYVDGAITIGGASVVNVYQGRPENFRIRVLGSSPVMVNNGSNLTGDIYAPQSAVTVQNAGGLSGAAVGDTLTILNSGCIHYDESLGYGTAGGIAVSSLK